MRPFGEAELSWCLLQKRDKAKEEQLRLRIEGPIHLVFQDLDFEWSFFNLKLTYSP